jgi:hypothetical protein
METGEGEDERCGDPTVDVDTAGDPGVDGGVAPRIEPAPDDPPFDGEGVDEEGARTVPWEVN